MEKDEIKRNAEAILFASGEAVESQRLCSVLSVTEDELIEALEELRDSLNFERRGIRLLKLENEWQFCSAPEFSELVTRALETRKPPRLSASAIETLTVVAYYQPTTKAFVEQVRGVDSSYTISALLNKKLIEEQGRLAVPGRPILYGTTPDFLRTFGLTSLNDLPEADLPEIKSVEQLEKQLSEEKQDGAEA